MEKNIILDTSFVLTAIKFKIDLSSELERICDFPYKLFIIDKTLDELRNKPNSKIALILIKHLNVGLIETRKDKNVDNLIMENADENSIVATQDIELKNRLKAKAIKVITIRQKQHLIIE